MNDGKQGEQLLHQRMLDRGWVVDNLTDEPNYFYKDIDFRVYNPKSGNTIYMECKWDERIAATDNLYLETWSRCGIAQNGNGWWLYTKADVLAYGDAVNRIFYIYPLLELKTRVKEMKLREVPTFRNGELESYGLLLPRKAVAEIERVL